MSVNFNLMAMLAFSWFLLLGFYATVGTTVSAAPSTHFPQQQNQKVWQRRADPLDLDQISALVPIMPDSALAGEIRGRGISFTIAADMINRLKKIGAGQETVEVLMKFTGNRPPTVTLQIAKNIAQTGEAVELTASANDPDNDSLDYVWTTDLGSIKGDGSIVALNTTGLTGVLPVTVNVSLMVFDRRGGAALARGKVVLRSAEDAARRLRRVDQREDVGKASEPLGVSTEVGSNVTEGSRADPKNSMVMKVTAVGEYMLVALVGAAGNKTESTGSLNITVDPLTGSSVTGMLAGIPCRVEVVSIENVAEYSLPVQPALENGWGRVVVRLRPKRRDLPVHLGIHWNALDLQAQKDSTKFEPNAVSVGFEKAIVLERISPEYPRVAILEHVAGSVIVSVEIDEQGSVTAAKGTQGPDSLREAAENAARRFRFRPARKDGHPTKSTELIQFDFKLAK